MVNIKNWVRKKKVNLHAVFSEYLIQIGWPPFVTCCTVAELT